MFIFFPIGWSQLDAVYEHGPAYTRSRAFYDQTLFWQWMRLPGYVHFAARAMLMAWDFIVKLRPVGALPVVLRESEEGGRVLS